MTKNQEFNLSEFTEEKLIEAKNNLEAEYGKYINECGEEIGYLINEKKS